MLNVTIFGFPEIPRGPEPSKVEEMSWRKDIRQYHAIKHTILTVLAQCGLAKDSVITSVASSAEMVDPKYQSRPYIRIYGSDTLEIQEFITGLKAYDLDLDTEWALIGGFISREKMKSGS
jgi:hypothetical protein